MLRFRFYLYSLVLFSFLTLCSFSCSKQDDPTPQVVTPAPGVVPNYSFDTTVALNKAEKLSFNADTTFAVSVEQAFDYKSTKGNSLITPKGQIRLDFYTDSSKIVQPSVVGVRWGELSIGENPYRDTQQLMSLAFGAKDVAGRSWSSYDIEGFPDRPATRDYYHTITKVTYLGRIDEKAYFSIEGTFTLSVEVFGNHDMPRKDLTGSYRKIWVTTRK
jgi:hypothetical protein